MRQKYKACIALVFRIHGDFNINAVHAYQNPPQNNLFSHTRPLKFISAPRKAKHFVGQFWQLMTASSVGAGTQAWQAKWAVFKNPGVCLQASPSFLPHPLPALLLAIFTLVPRFFAPKPHGNACYAGYLFFFFFKLSIIVRFRFRYSLKLTGYFCFSSLNFVLCFVLLSSKASHLLKGDVTRNDS